MAYICGAPEQYEGKKVGSGECVAFVQAACTSAPPTAHWTRGIAVRDNGAKIQRGTAIATFDANGKYQNHRHGNHAAIYLGQDAIGISVYDQFQPNDFRPSGVVEKRTIRWEGIGASNNGDSFFVIE